MDSPESSTGKVNASTAVIASSSSNSPSVLESPFSHFVSTFSPLTVGNSSRTSHVFVGLNSPPLIFTTPRVNPIHETSLVIREGNIHTSKGDDVRENENENKEHLESVNWDKSAIDINACLAISSRDTATDNDEQVQGSGSSERVDKYLADYVEDNSTWSDHAVDQKLNQLHRVLEVSPMNADTATGSLKVMPDSEKDTSTESQIEEGAKGQGTLGGGEGDVQREDKNCEGKCKYCLHDLHDKCKCLDTQSEKVGCGKECKLPFENPSEHIQTVQALEDPNNNVELLLNKSNNNLGLESEGNQQQRGMSRRCLQFEEAQPKAKSNADNSLPISAFLRSVAASSKIDPFGSTTSCSRHLINASATMNDVPCSATNVRQIAPSSKPFGFGVHLNSIVRTAPFHHDANASMKPSDCSMSVLEIRSKVIAGTASPQEVTNDEFLQDPDDFKVLQELDDLATTPCDKGKFVPENPDHLEQLDQVSPQKKKKKVSGNLDDDGNKRCSCKKTKCLKLYCDCLAAGVYCDESCSCQGCLNKPEYAETVLQTRQQIESRNPLAFAPKIIQRGSDFSISNMETETLTTPASARHKRGCNCKKSKCLKKYCECFQGGVGCSRGCRCENCQNVYGKKDDYSAEEFLSSRAITERSEPDKRMDLVVARKSLSQAETNHVHKLTPVTPSLQQSDHGKGAPKSQIIIRRYKPTTESDQRVIRNSNGNNANPESSADVANRRSYNRETRQRISELTKYITSRFNQVKTNPQPSPIRCSSNSLDSAFLNIVEDGNTLENLTDASTPIKAVKVCSPSRKRVSPPQHNLSEAGSSSSGPLRSGRKFILKALPPFPPLTPCIENKSLESQKPDDNPQPED